MNSKISIKESKEVIEAIADGDIVLAKINDLTRLCKIIVEEMPEFDYELYMRVIPLSGTNISNIKIDNDEIVINKSYRETSGSNIIFIKICNLEINITN